MKKYSICSEMFTNTKVCITWRDWKIPHSNYANVLYSMAAWSRQEVLKKGLIANSKIVLPKEEAYLSCLTKDLLQYALLLMKKGQFSNLVEIHPLTFR